MSTTDKIMTLASAYTDAYADGDDTSSWHTELRAEIEALARDAERYRWLCSYAIIPAPSLWDNGVGFVTPALPRKSGAMNKHELDAVIDIALAEEDAAIDAAMQEKQS